MYLLLNFGCASFLKLYDIGVHVYLTIHNITPLLGALQTTVWLMVILNKPVFENADLHVPAADSVSPVVSVSVPLSSLLLLLYCVV